MGSDKTPTRGEVQSRLRAYLTERGENPIWVGMDSMSMDYQAALDRGLITRDEYDRARTFHGRQWSYAGA